MWKCARKKGMAQKMRWRGTTVYYFTHVPRSSPGYRVLSNFLHSLTVPTSLILQILVIIGSGVFYWRLSKNTRFLVWFPIHSNSTRCHTIKIQPNFIMLALKLHCSMWMLTFSTFSTEVIWPLFVRWVLCTKSLHPALDRFRCSWASSLQFRLLLSALQGVMMSVCSEWCFFVSQLSSESMVLACTTNFDFSPMFTTDNYVMLK